MKPHRYFLGIIAVLSVFAITLNAAAPNVSGNWKWTFERDGEKREIGMKLKQEGAKVTGTITGPDGNTVEVRQGKIADDGKITFLLEIERDGNTMKIEFAGKASADTITGTTSFTNPEGEVREREWVAKREAKKVAHDLTGEWRSTIKRQDSTPLESTLLFRQADELLTGLNRNRGGEMEIQDAKIEGDQVTFRILRERDGRTITSKYSGKISDGTIIGHMESDWSGEFRKMEWEAKKTK